MGIIDQIKASQAMNRASATTLAEVSVSQARLPQSYEQAKTALANCVSIDECIEWANKAEALASYAKQSNDDALVRYATRIQDRAIRRCGELLKQIDPGKGGRPRNSGAGRPSFDGWVPGAEGKSEDPSLEGWIPGTRTEAAEAAGLSEHRKKTALRVANIPASEFDALVEGETPANLTALAARGTKPKAKPYVFDLKGRDPAAFNRSLHFVADIGEYAKAVVAFDLDLILPGLSADEAAEVRRHIGAIDAVHDRIITRV